MRSSLNSSQMNLTPGHDQVEPKPPTHEAKYPSQNPSLRSKLRDLERGENGEYIRVIGTRGRRNARGKHEAYLNIDSPVGRQAATLSRGHYRLRDRGELQFQAKRSDIHTPIQRTQISPILRAFHRLTAAIYITVEKSSYKDPKSHCDSGLRCQTWSEQSGESRKIPAHLSKST